MIPNVIHFVFGLRDDFGSFPFSFVHYLAIKSAYECNHPAAIKFHHKYEPKGEWWEKSKGYLNLVKVDVPTEIFGNKLLHYAHQTDVLRLEILLREGGIYLDMDVICLNSFRPLLRHDCVMGREGRYGLCNAVIMAKPGSKFLKTWYDQYRNFKSTEWNKHSVFLPLELARRNAEDLHIEDPFAFFWPTISNPGVLWRKIDPRASFLMKSKDRLAQMILQHAYCMHLWNQGWWDKYLKDLAPDYLRKTDNLFSRLCLKFIDPARKPKSCFSADKCRWIIPLVYFILNIARGIYRTMKAMIFPVAKWRAERNLGSVFTSVYHEGLWGGRPGELYSGPGSHDDLICMPYVNRIVGFLKDSGAEKLRVIDLGCGDFNVGRQLAPHCGQYVGADIVEDLIKKHRETQHANNVKFCVLDMIKDELPDGDIALVRQVFQHLSNEQISKILPKLKKYKVVFITEHYPNENDDTIPNKNIVPGVGTRLAVDSGVYLDKPPFNISADSLKLVLEVPAPLGGGGECIRTYKYVPS